MFRMTKSLCCIHVCVWPEVSMNILKHFRRAAWFWNYSDTILEDGIQFRFTDPSDVLCWRFICCSLLQATFTFETVAPGLTTAVKAAQVAPMNADVFLLLLFFSIDCVCRSVFSGTLWKWTLWYDSPHSLASYFHLNARLNFLFDQMLLLIFSVILWYDIIPVNQDCSKPGESSHRHSSHISLHRVTSTRLEKGGRSRVAAPWWLPSYQVSSEGDISL